MDPLSATASIIAILQLSAKVLKYLNDVKDASKDRAQCAIEASNLHSLLVSLRFRLEAEDSSQPWYTSIRALAVENGPLDQFKEALETLQTKMTDRGRLKQAGQALVWKFRKEEIASILARMERLKALVEVALQMDNFKLSRAIKDDTSFVRTHVPAIQTGVDTLRQDQDSVRHYRLLEWISPTDYPAQQTDIIKRRQEGTGQWFLDAPEVTRWLSEAKSTLFCPGIPGAGKTMIAAIAINYLLESVQNSSHGIAYVYCNYQAQEGQDTSSILAAILKQLIQGRPSTIEPVERLHQHYAAKGTKLSPDKIFSALRDILAHYSTVHIVIDALDECRNSDGTRRQILSKIRDLQARGDVRLMATSRFLPDIVNEFREALTLEIRASNEDVRRFVAGQTYRLPRCIQRNLTLQDLVEGKIVEAVDGMFLLARLHTDSLLDKRTPKDVKSTLARLSKGSAALDTAYKDALQRIEDQLRGDRELAKKVLSWITFAKRPLTTAEICCALAIEVGQVKLDPENVADVEDLVSVCAGLVVVDPESAVIRLVHYTTQEYFERIRDVWNPSVQSDIATTCLTYLSFSVFRRGTCSTDREFEERLQHNKFLAYAAKHWGEHARSVEAEVSNLACSFLLEDGPFSCAEQVLLAPSYRNSGYSQRFPSGTNLHFVARFGLTQTTQELLSLSNDRTALIINMADNDGRAALSIAAEHGHEKLVQLLLEKGARVNAQGGQYCSALQAASAEGHEQIVKLLLEKGADVNAQGGYYGSALHAASDRGHRQIVKVLLENGAEVNAQGGHYGSALQAASAEGREQIVQLLLENSAKVNVQDGYYSSALQLASAKGSEQIVKQLLEKGANVNAQGGYYSSALEAASAKDNEQIVQLLLENGADANIHNGYYGSVLQMASAEGHRQIVKLLLEKGADVNTQSGYYSSALQAASDKGHEQIVKLLLEKGADVNIQGGHYGSALQAASDNGHKQVLQLLISRDISLRFQDLYGRTPLWWAAAGGHTAIVEALKNQHGFDPQEGDKFGRTPLWVATKKGYNAVSRILSENCKEIELEQTALPKSDNDRWSITCDVCTLQIRAAAFHYHCRHCADGDWGLCEDCRIIGASCADATHTLVKRTVKNGDLIEVAS